MQDCYTTTGEERLQLFASLHHNVQPCLLHHQFAEGPVHLDKVL